MVAICVIRSGDLVSNRSYIRNSDIASFGTGLSWWFPQGAADFIERTSPPGELFNSYNEGGYVLWRLGTRYRDYIDGRAIPFGSELFNRNGKLLSSAPDSSEWQQEAERYHINSIIIPVGRYVGVRAFSAFRQFCSSDMWAPVYLDETSGVFVRRTAETEQFVERYRISCAGIPLPAKAPERNDRAAYNRWANAAAVLHELGREAEALAATDKAVAIDTDSGYLYFLRGEILAAMGNPVAEGAYLRATALQPNEVDWSSLARLYQRERRYDAAMYAWEKAAEVSDDPARARLSLGYAALDSKKPKDALRAFDQAHIDFQRESAADNSFAAHLAHGRALAWATLGDLKRAISYEEETVRLAPDRAEDWLQLSNLYLHDGRLEDAQRSRQRASETNSHFQP